MVEPRMRAGALVGAAVGAALTAVLWAASEAARLTFPPYDLFDWMARALPGGLVTFGIDSMVTVIRALGAEAATVAKTAELTLAIGIFIVGATLAGAALFWALRRVPPERRPWAGGVGGLLLAVPFVLAALLLRRGGADDVLWTLAAFAGWGVAVGWAQRRLARSPRTGAATAPREEPGVVVLDRRRFMVKLGGSAAVITVAGAAVGAFASSRRREVEGVAWSARNRLPNEGADVEPVAGTRPELTPLDMHYRIDINARPLEVSGEDWRLRIDGLVDRPMTLTLEDLRAYPPTDQFVTLACISNRIAGSLTSTTRWTGVPLMRVLDDAGLRPDATHLRIRSIDGFHETLDLAVPREDERVMLTYAWDGLPLRPRHGFPLRIYIPDRYGMKQPKWIDSIEAIAEWEPGYWVRRGWDREARMKATSVIDAVATDMMLTEMEGGMTVPVGGIAHAGARGISRVEVSVDGGPWQAARLREPLSETTWVLWRYDWPFQEGDHTFAVRCFDGDGTPQIAERTPVRPDGATGIHSTQVML